MPVDDYFDRWCDATGKRQLTAIWCTREEAEAIAAFLDRTPNETHFEIDGNTLKITCFGAQLKDAI